MAITTGTPNNKKYCTLSGTFTGTVVTQYLFRMQNGSGTTFKWRKKVGNEPWGSDTTVSDHSANTAYSIADGMSVTFTRSSLGSYLEGDRWIFTVAPDYKLAPADSANAFDRLIPIDKDDDQHLIAINSRSGETAYIENFNTDEPNIIQTKSIPAKETGYDDFVVNNKLAYVGVGKSSGSQVVGYVKNNLWGIPDAQEFEKIQEKSYQTVSVSAVSHQCFTDFVKLRGDGSNEEANSRLVVGFNYGEDENAFFVWNKHTNKVYKRGLPGTPLAIKRCPFIQHGSTAGQVTGIAILMKSVNGGYINFFQTYEISDDGVTITFKKSFNLEAPQHNTELPKFSDFLIVPRLADLTSNSNVYDLWLSAGDINSSKLKDGYLFKVENFKNYNESEHSGSDGGNIEAGDYIPTSPKSSYDGDVAADMWVRREINDGGNEESPTRNDPSAIQRANLNLIGYDANGAEPMVGVTVRLQNLDAWEDMSQDDYGGYFEASAKPLWWDGNKHWHFKWVTYCVPRDASGRPACHMLVHMKDDSDSLTEQFNEAAFSGNSIPSPASKPHFARNNSLESGDRAYCYGDTTSGRRLGWYYIKSAGEKPDLLSKREDTGMSSYQSADIGLFPTNNQDTYTTFDGYSSATSASYNADQAVTDLPNVEGSNHYFLSDRDIRMQGIANNTALPSLTYVDLMRQDGIGDEHYTQILGGQTLASNNIANVAPWFNIDTPTKHNSNKWTGDEAVKKVWYQCSLVYDGFQESALIGSPTTFADTGNAAFTKALTVPIEIDEPAINGDNAKISRRVTAVVLYRADDTGEDQNEPEGLFRYVEEISIDKFYIVSNKYTYSVEDDGTRGASYEALNGMPETLGDLGLRYTCNASVNGYMFAGNCYHGEFPDGENLLFRSEPGKYSIFNWSQNFIQLDFIPVALEGFLGKLYVFGKNQMCIVNPETLVIEENIKGIGCLGPKALKTTSSGLFWFDYNNIYHSSPKIEKIGTRILDQQGALGLGQFGWNQLTNAEKDEAIVGFDATKQTILVFFTHVEGNTTHHLAWAYYIPQKRFDLWETDYKILDSVDGDDGTPILLASQGRILKMCAHDTDRRDWEWVSKKLTFGTDTNYKKARVIKAEANSRSGTDVQYQTNDTSASTAKDGTDVSNNYGNDWKGNAIKIDSADSKIRWLRVKLSGTNASSTDRKVYSLGVIYKPKKPK